MRLVITVKMEHLVILVFLVIVAPVYLAIPARKVLLVFLVRLVTTVKMVHLAIAVYLVIVARVYLVTQARLAITVKTARLVIPALAELVLQVILVAMGHLAIQAELEDEERVAVASDGEAPR